MNTNLLKYYLASKNVTMQDLAKSMGLSITALSRKMNEKTDFKREEIMAIVKIIGIDREAMIKIFFEDFLS